MTKHRNPARLLCTSAIILVVACLTGPATAQDSPVGSDPSASTTEALQAAPIAPPAERAEITAQRWEFLRGHYFGDRVIERADDWIVLDAPARAADAAIVPIRIMLTPPAGQRVTSVHLLVDQNPIPRAAIFHFTGQQAVPVLETRLRVDDYSNITVVAELQNGSMWNTSRYVKASGGCSAPMAKSLQSSVARMGKMKLNLPDTIVAGKPVTAQLLISHPNYTGMQYDQLNHYFIPAHYVKTVAIRYNGTPVLDVQSDISLSEDPSIHFSLVPDEQGTLEVIAEDSNGRIFNESWPIRANSGS